MSLRLALAVSTFLLNATYSDGAPLYTQSTRFEAEHGTLSNVVVATAIEGYSGTGYVTGFKSSNCSVNITFTVPSAGLYEVLVGYHSGFGDKDFDFSVNHGATSSGTFKNSGSRWGRTSAGKILLPAGSNSFYIMNGWGFFQVDYIDVAQGSVEPPKPPPKTLSNPNATVEADKLMAYLVDTFGHSVLAGAQVRDKGLKAATDIFAITGSLLALDCSLLLRPHEHLLPHQQASILPLWRGD